MILAKRLNRNTLLKTKFLFKIRRILLNLNKVLKLLSIMSQMGGKCYKKISYLKRLSIYVCNITARHEYNIFIIWLKRKKQLWMKQIFVILVRDRKQRKLELFLFVIQWKPPFVL